jgi:hypothetical protein
MSITLELKPEIEAVAQAQATIHGVAVEHYLESVLESLIGQNATPAASVQLTGDEIDAFLDELSDGLDHMPVLTQEALTRAGIYGDHD